MFGKTLATERLKKSSNEHWEKLFLHKKDGTATSNGLKLLQCSEQLFFYSKFLPKGVGKSGVGAVTSYGIKSL